MSVPLATDAVLNTLEQQAISEIKAYGAVRFGCGLMDGRLYYQAQHVGHDFVDRIKAAAENSGITVYRKDDYSDGGLIGEGYDLTSVTLTTTKFKTALDALCENLK